jgi:hypothetical protein
MSLLQRIGFNTGNKPVEQAPADGKKADLGGARPSRFRPMMGLLNRAKPETEAATFQAKGSAPMRHGATDLKTRMEAQKHRTRVASHSALVATQASSEAATARMQAELDTQMAEMNAHMDNTAKVADMLRNFDLGGTDKLRPKTDDQTRIDPMMDDSSSVTSAADDMSMDDLDAAIAQADAEVGSSSVTDEKLMDDLANAAIAAADADIDSASVTGDISMDDLDAEMDAAGKALSDRVDKMQVDNQKKAQAEADNEAAQSQAAADNAGQALSDRLDKMQLNNQRNAEVEAEMEALQAQVDAEPGMTQAELEQSIKDIDAEIGAKNPGAAAQTPSQPSQAAKQAADNASIEARFQALMGGQQSGPPVVAGRPSPQVAQQPLPSHPRAPARPQAAPRAPQQPLVQARASNQSAQFQPRAPVAASPRQTYAPAAANTPARPAAAANQARNQAVNQARQNAQNQIQQMQQRMRDQGVARTAVNTATRVTQEMVKQNPSLTTSGKKEIYERTMQRMLAKELQKNNPMIAGKSRDDNFLIGDKNVNVGRYIDFKVQQFIEKNPESLKPPAYLRVN